MDTSYLVCQVSDNAQELSHNEIKALINYPTAAEIANTYEITSNLSDLKAITNSLQGKLKVISNSIKTDFVLEIPIKVFEDGGT